MTSFSYDLVRPECAEEWRALRLRCVRDFPMGFLATIEETEPVDVENCQRLLNQGGFRGVFSEDGLVGYCGYYPQPYLRARHRAQVGPFVVDQRFHGSGAAQALMAGIFREATAGGVEQIELFVDSENTRAIRFYEKLGFRNVAVFPDYCRMDGESRDHDVMVATEWACDRAIDL